MFDVDHYKQVNDSYGHVIGDNVLVKVAEVLKESFRATDILARYGGDEFAILLLDTEVNKSVMMAERLREKIDYIQFKADEDTFSITISVGIAMYSTVKGESMDLIAAADRALYISKENGKNKTTIYG